MTAIPILTQNEGQALIETLDTGVFRLQSETTQGDRRTLLALQAIVRRERPGYVYAEIGSFLGGTLFPHLIDPSCALAVSIDKRPDTQPDERSVTFDYTHSSTARMLERLDANLPGSATLKLITHDCDAAALPPAVRATPFDLALIDGEHTNRAAFQDFLSLWRFAAPDSVIAFHDANLIPDALGNIESMLRHQGVAFESLVMPDVVFVLLLGRFARFAGPLARRALDKEAYFAAAKETLWNEIARTRARAA